MLIRHSNLPNSSHSVLTFHIISLTSHDVTEAVLSKWEIRLAKKKCTRTLKTRHKTKQANFNSYWIWKGSLLWQSQPPVPHLLRSCLYHIIWYCVPNWIFHAGSDDTSRNIWSKLKIDRQIGTWKDTICWVLECSCRYRDKTQGKRHRRRKRKSGAGLKARDTNFHSFPSWHQNPALSWDSHIAAMSRAAISQYRLIAQHSSYLDKGALRTLGQALIISQTVYGNALYTGLPLRLTWRLQQI